MKRIIAILLLVVIAACACMNAWATDVAEEPAWYELTRDDFGQDVLTVRLDSNPSTGFDWSFEISDPELLELLTMEFVSDTYDEPVCGAGGEWVASFRNFTGKAGECIMTFVYARPWEDRPIEEKHLRIQINEAGQIEIMPDEELPEIQADESAME